MWLTRLALRYPITTFLAACTIVVLGLVSFTQLRIDLLPDISIPVISVITFYNGAGPLDMEQTVTTFIERGVSSTNNVAYVQSSTKEGISQVRINFDWEANLDVALVDVIQRVNRIFNQLPTGVSTPIALRFDITTLPVCAIAVSGGGMDANIFNVQGLPCVGLGIGIEAAHSPQEHIAVAQLKAGVRFIEALLKEAVVAA